MTRFVAETEEIQGQVFHALRDRQTGASARILTSFGANCLQLKLAAGPDLPIVAVIDDLASLDQLTTTPSRLGIPILFPWASDLAGGGFRFNGKDYQFRQPGDSTLCYHGFVHTAQWQVREHASDDTAAWLTCSIDSAQCNNFARQFPSQTTLHVTWHLSETGMEMQFTAYNTGDTPMPAGFGLHPYFHMPLTGEGTPAECAISADVGRQWDLKAISSIRPPDPAPATQFLDQPGINIQHKPIKMNNLSLNHVFEAQHDSSSNQTSASLFDYNARLKLSIHADRQFGTWVLYTPPGRDAISLEPWTMVPNGFNLMEAGMDNSGVKVLPPGEKWSGTVKFSLHQII